VNSKRRKYVRTQLFGSQHGKCTLCKKPMLWEESNLDHIIPLAAGGEDAWCNLQMTHITCNSAKADREPSPEILEYLAECRRWAKHGGES
jgi:5-methylcytosine-specific restriction endonuclease McrA